MTCQIGTYTPPTRMSGRFLVAAALVLAAAGCSLVAFGLSGGTTGAPVAPAATVSRPSSPAARTASPSPTQVTPARQRPIAETPSATAMATPVSRASELPPPDSGPSADPIVQRALEQAIPANLPAGTARHLVSLGRAVWTAEVTGTGRRRWPHYFTAVGPGSGYTRFRIRAAIARRDSSSRAVVHLVWAAADPSGTFLDGRTATVHFTAEGDTWTPVR
jgi:hypothetical protein